MTLGEIGETSALRYLESKGYGLVCRNFRFLRAEIDLVVKKDSEKLVVFAYPVSPAG